MDHPSSHFSSHSRPVVGGRDYLPCRIPQVAACRGEGRTVGLRPRKRVWGDPSASSTPPEPTMIVLPAICPRNAVDGRTEPDIAGPEENGP